MRLREDFVRCARGAGWAVVCGSALALAGCSGDETEDRGEASGGATSSAGGGTNQDPVGTGGGDSTVDPEPTIPATDEELIAALGNAFGTPGEEPPDPPAYERSTSPAPTDTTEPCDTTQLVGTYDGEPIDELYSRGSRSYGSVSTWFYSVSVRYGGSATVEGDGLISDFDALPLGEPQVGTEGRFRIPSHLEGAGRIACVTGETSLTREENHFALSLGGVGYLPSCEDGTPVDGTLTLCVGDSCEDMLVGDLDGVTRGEGGGASYSWGSTSFTGSVSDLGLELEYQAVDALNATLRKAWITDEETGEVYCAGPGSGATAEGELGTFDELEYKHIVTLTDFRKVGDCGDLDGADDLVVRACFD